MPIARGLNISTQQRKVLKFEVGKVYYTRFVTSYDTIIKVKILSRTEKTIKWIQLSRYKQPEVKTSRPFVFEGVENFYPIGRYSLAPVIRANWIYAESKY